MVFYYAFLPTSIDCFLLDCDHAYCISLHVCLVFSNICKARLREIPSGYVFRNGVNWNTCNSAWPPNTRIFCNMAICLACVWHGRDLLVGSSFLRWPDTGAILARKVWLYVPLSCNLALLCDSRRICTFPVFEMGVLQQGCTNFLSTFLVTFHYKMHGI